MRGNDSYIGRIGEDWKTANSGDGAGLTESILTRSRDGWERGKNGYVIGITVVVMSCWREVRINNVEEALLLTLPAGGEERWVSLFPYSLFPVTGRGHVRG